MSSKQESKQSLGGKARAAALTAEQRSAIARKGALAKSAASKPKATHRGSFKEHFDIDVDCYVLDDEQKTAVISKRGMSATLGMGEGATVFSTFINAEKLATFVGIELAEKIANPLVFMALDSGSKLLPTPAHGYDVTILIDVCRAILAASDAGILKRRHQHIVKQAGVILHASAKAGIKNLVYAVAGYDATREEVIAAFKFYVQAEARQYEKEFPEQLYEEWYRLYELTRPERNKPWKFRDLTIKHVYQPLAKSNGKIYQLTRTSREKSEERHKKLHQFLSEVGVKALRTHLGRLLGMAETSPTRAAYEAHVQRVFGVQLELSLDGQP